MTIEERLRVEPLTAREQTILTLLCEGKTTKQIEGKLFSTSSAIRNNVSSLYSKLGTEPQYHCLVIAAQQLNLTQGA